ncbi:hypothetical protein M011DRAFT_377417, partial [Sporormia fimetaria CBS 119925]
PSMPPPSDFDYIPDLERLLKRLTATPTAPPTSTPGPTSAKDKDGPLDPQQLVGEANAIRRKIQRAREKVLALPDVERSVEDQEEEIRELGARIERLKGVLRGLR